MRKFAWFLLFFFFLFCRSSIAQLSDIGIDPFRTEVGARPLAMGGAFVGLADDVDALLYNPGGMAWAKGVSLTLRDFDNVTALQAYPTGYGSSLGLGVVTTKISGISISSGTASSNSNVILLSYGTKLNFLPELYYRQEALQRLGLGMNIKILMGQTLARTGLPDRSATGWNMDLGALWKGTEWWNVGLSLQNVLPAKFLGGGEIKWDAGTEEGFTTYGKLAGSAKIIGDIGAPVFMEGRELLVGGEIDVLSARPVLLRLGGEWSADKKWFVRTGIMQQEKANSVLTSLNFGLGYRSELWGADLVSYREPVRDEAIVYLSFLYFPREWIVIKKLEVDKPSVVLEKPFEQISLTDNYITYDEKLDVLGKVKSGVEVFINGLRAATAPDNTFKVVVPLDMEKNLILVEARYEGENKTWKYKVLRKAKIQMAEEKKLKKEMAKALTAKEKELLKKKEEELKQRRQRVEELVTLGVIEVTPEAEFKLEASITRGELAAWLVKAAGLPLPKVEHDLFLDVKRNHPLAPYIKLAVEWDMLKPFSDGTFRPGAPVSKEEGEKLYKLLGIRK